MSEADEERELRMDQMRADIENKKADSEYKRGLLRYEPWRLAFAAVTAVAAVFGVLGGMIGFIIGHGR